MEKTWRQEVLSKKMNAEDSPELFECSKCNNSKKFQDTGTPLVLFQINDDNKIDMDKGIFVHALSCTKCGFMELRSLTALGIDPRS